ncbi:hypothetical protein FRB99_002625, partial [Tulasnella sp. 403]
MKVKKVHKSVERLRPEDNRAVDDSIRTGTLVRPTPPPEDDAETRSSPDRGQGVGAKRRKRKAPAEEAYDPPAEVPDIYGQSGAADDAEPHDELYARLLSEVVGVQDYAGLIRAEEIVSLERGPDNEVDRNTIRVVNANDVQVGCLRPGDAEKLAPLMDRGLITVEGEMITGNMSGERRSTLGITLLIYGPSDPDTRAELEPYLLRTMPEQRNRQNQTGIASTSRSPKKSRPQPAMPSLGAAPGGGPSPSESQKNYELARMMSQLARKDDPDRRETVLDSLCDGGVLGLPVYENPPSRANGYLKTNLLKHQSQGLSAVQLWKLEGCGDEMHYYNLATRTPRKIEDAPVLGRGAIMADSMGLGKTLTMLALIIATLDDKPNHSNATLIVAPLSVMSNRVCGPRPIRTPNPDKNVLPRRRRLAEFLRAHMDMSLPAPKVPMVANVLSILTRLRQLALHPALLPPNYLEDLRRQRDMGHAGDVNYVSPEVRVKLQRLLSKAIRDGEECSICFDVLNDPRILPCAHYFCYECIDEVIKRQEPCPWDRQDITKTSLIQPPPPPPEDYEGSDEDGEEKDPDALLTPP